MDAEATYLKLKKIAIQEFSDIVVSTSIIRGPLNTVKSLRIFFKDDSFLEIWISNGKYSYHWQTPPGKIFRHDNAPHKRHRKIKTFPKHFHNGYETNVKESKINDNPEDAITEFLIFIRNKIKQKTPIS